MARIVSPPLLYLCYYPRYMTSRVLVSVSYLEVKRSGLGSLFERRVLATLLVQSVELFQIPTVSIVGFFSHFPFSIPLLFHSSNPLILSYPLLSCFPSPSTRISTSGAGYYTHRQQLFIRGLRKQLLASLSGSGELGGLGDGHFSRVFSV